MPYSTVHFHLSSLLPACLLSLFRNNQAYDVPDLSLLPWLLAFMHKESSSSPYHPTYLVSRGDHKLYSYASPSPLPAVLHVSHSDTNTITTTATSLPRPTNPQIPSREVCSSVPADKRPL
ncbi:hypothetical protein E2C01_078424 [Portunus trituberculatus]|uniref:Uncharacterized protein n=1 Tax=Portunus trituberculatus TaxID=210409 RepID=A0A5B7INT3_PORTR|nr:hypothetical protein [Portunus trituberculatus]